MTTLIICGEERKLRNSSLHNFILPFVHSSILDPHIILREKFRHTCICGTTLNALTSQSHVTTDDQAVSKSWFQGPSGIHDRILISVWHLLFYRCRDVGSVICISHLTASVQYFFCWPLPATLSRTAFGLPSSHRRGTSPPTIALTSCRISLCTSASQFLYYKTLTVFCCKVKWDSVAV
jgi:hypothetical protein